MAAHPKNSAIRESVGDRLFNIINVIILTAVLVCVLYPLYFILVASITDPMVVNRGGLLLYPKVPYFGGLQKIFQFEPIWRGYRNTILYTSLGTLVNLCVTLPGAYALSRKDLPGGSFLTKAFVFTMFFSGGLIPSYIVNSALGLRNNLWTMVLPMSLNVWNLVITRTFFQNNLPGEMLDAAYIDGCSDFRYFFQMVLPVSKAIIAVITLFYAVSHWNSYFHALIYLNDDSAQPLQTVLRNLLIINQINSTEMTADMRNMTDRVRLAEQLKYGVIVVSSLPLLVVYPFLQKHFAQGVMVGSLKG